MKPPSVLEAVVAAEAFHPLRCTQEFAWRYVFVCVCSSPHGGVYVCVCSSPHGGVYVCVCSSPHGGVYVCVYSSPHGGVYVCVCSPPHGGVCVQLGMCVQFSTWRCVCMCSSGVCESMCVSMRDHPQVSSQLQAGLLCCSLGVIYWACFGDEGAPATLRGTEITGSSGAHLCHSEVRPCSVLPV